MSVRSRLRAFAIPLGVCFGALSSGCGARDGSERLQISSSPAVFGTDDRVEVFAHTSSVWHDVATHSVAGIISAERLSRWRFCDPNGWTFTGSTVAQHYELCPEEPFAEQPTMLGCSGTLVDDDIVATANHCIPDSASCRAVSIVMGHFAIQHVARIRV